MEGGESSGSVKQAKGKQTERSASSKTITNTDLWSMLHTRLASLEDAVEEVLKELKRRRTHKDDEDEDDDDEDDEDDEDDGDEDEDELRFGEGVERDGMISRYDICVDRQCIV